MANVRWAYKVEVSGDRQVKAYGTSYRHLEIAVYCGDIVDDGRTDALATFSWQTDSDNGKESGWYGLHVSVNFDSDLWAESKRLMDHIVRQHEKVSAGSIGRYTEPGAIIAAMGRGAMQVVYDPRLGQYVRHGELGAADMGVWEAKFDNPFSTFSGHRYLAYDEGSARQGAMEYMTAVIAAEGYGAGEFGRWIVSGRPMVEVEYHRIQRPGPADYRGAGEKIREGLEW